MAATHSATVTRASMVFLSACVAYPTQGFIMRCKAGQLLADIIILCERGRTRACSYVFRDARAIVRARQSDYPELEPHGESR